MAEVMLSTAQLQEFQTQGFLVLRQAAPAAFCEQVIAYAEQQLTDHVLPIEYEADTRYPGAPAHVRQRVVTQPDACYRSTPVSRCWRSGQPEKLCLRLCCNC